jgi:magnesium-transporting ATPase (P-type)
MSVILRDSNGDILLLCKGADSIIENRLVVSDHHAEAFNALQRYASMGLRTLMLA